MKIGPPQVAFITGAGSGIGRAFAIALAQKCVQLSIVDVNETSGLETLKLVEEEYGTRGIPGKFKAVFIKCDVSKPDEISLAFQRHKDTFGRLDICINNAGIGEAQHGFFREDQKRNGNGSWRKVIDINLIAVIDCTRMAVQEMIASGKGGTILNVGSAAGLYPAVHAPVYSAAKGGVVLFTRSLKGLAKQKIRVNVICPEFLETNLTKPIPNQILERFGGFIPMETFLKGAFELLEDENKAGACLWISNQQGLAYWPTSDEEKKYSVYKNTKQKLPGLKSEAYIVPLPSKYRKIVVYKLSNRFREATRITTVPLHPVKDGHVLVKYIYAGVNASDINYSAGYYYRNKQEALSKLPFDAGFEAVGIIAAVGQGVTRQDLLVGSPIAAFNYGSFAEFGQVSASYAIPVPSLKPEVVSMLTSGLTALLGLEEAGKMRTGETVLITAAAGGTGQFAVQLAKLAGNTVIATCGSAEKASLLKELGADRIINYKKENVSEVLKREFPKGLDLVYESVGGEMFQTCLNALAVFGRLVIIGMMSQYQMGETWQQSTHAGICEKLLWKSQSLVGFFLNHYVSKWHSSVQRLHKLFEEGKLKIAMDPNEFNGLESVANAVEHLHSGQSIGKVVVKIQSPDSSSAHSRL